MNHAMIVLIALLLNIALFGSRWFGELTGLTGIAALPGAVIRASQRKLNRSQRSAQVRRSRGVMLVMSVVVLSLVTGLLLDMLSTSRLRVVDILLLALLLPVRQSWECARVIYKALRADDLASARLALKDTVWRHFGLLDAHGVARAAIELLAVQFSEKILAPVLWYLVLGLPGFLIDKSLYLLKETLCQPMASENDFGRPAIQAHFIANYIPARLAMGLWIAALFFFPVGNPIASLRRMEKGNLAQLTPERVSVLAASCALNLALGGPTSVYTLGNWHGSGTAKVRTPDIRRALILAGMVQLLLVLLLAFLSL